MYEPTIQPYVQPLPLSCTVTPFAPFAFQRPGQMGDYWEAHPLWLFVRGGRHYLGVAMGL